MLRFSKAFFSYSRHDSEFTLKLAKDLRAAGAPVWLDQLDIAPGRHWDTAVENAISVSSSLLVVLSPDSIQSENVMDEVSYALEEGKLVIPVLYRDCKIPLRLRRLQYIDLRTDYQAGLAEIRKMLEVDQQGETSPPSAREPQAHAAEQLAQQRAEAGEQAAHAQAAQEGIARVNEERRERERIAGQSPGRQPIAAPQQPVSDDTTKTSEHPRRKFRITVGIAVAFSFSVVVLVWMGNVSKSHQSPASQPSESTVAEASRRDAAAPDVRPASPIGSQVGEKKEVPAESTAFNAREWIARVLKASEGPSVDDLLPFYDTTVSPYFSQPHATWADIAKDKQAYFKHFPRIEYTLMDTPREFPQSDGSINVEYDIQYSNLRSDGVIVHGTSHAWASLRQIDGKWKITGISERVQ
jgi:hypothetical protein